MSAIRPAVWRCRCHAWGYGGPDGWIAHRESAHREGEGATSSVLSIGFTGDEHPRYGVRYWTWGTPAWAADSPGPGSLTPSPEHDSMGLAEPCPQPSVAGFVMPAGW